jgi:hypothetical protein
MINQFDKANLNQVRADINAALLAVTAKHGIDIAIGSISYNAASFTTKMTVRTRNTDLANKTMSFDLRRLGLPENAIGRTIVFKGIAYTITGLNKRKKRYPIETRKITDNSLVCFGSALAASLLVGTGQGG